MNAAEMNEMIETHIKAESAGDTVGAVAVYTHDVEHDVVDFPTGPVRGKDAARGFYEYLTRNFTTEKMVPTHSHYGDDFCVLEHQATGVVNGEFLGVAGHGKRITFRLLHVWEFRDGLISRANVWLDGGTAIAQLTTAGETLS